MRARALGPRPPERAIGALPPTRLDCPAWRQLALAWIAFVAVVLGTAAIVAAIAPDWLGGSTRALPDSAGLIGQIAVNNALLALLPLFGGWLAASHRRAGRRVVALPFAIAPALITARSLLTIGAVGGADPAWLADAARWWLLELAAYAAAGYTGLWLVGHPEALDTPAAPRAMRRAFAVIAIALPAGAAVEVLTA